MPKRGTYAKTVRYIDAWAAIFCVCERDQVVNHEHRTNLSVLHRGVIPWMLHAVVARVQKHGTADSRVRRYYLVNARARHDPTDYMPIATGRRQNIKRPL